MMTDTNKSPGSRKARLTMSATKSVAAISPAPNAGSTTPIESPAVEPSPKPPSKQAQLAGLLVRDEGATLDQMIATTGWLPHTTRAALTGLKKKGYAISSDKIDGLRTYRAVAPEAAR